ncbi:type II toxin-antitoxin system PemK/MazF family toxin [Pusillimonas sp. ANT_WB101]|uniref:type II toxin-antitoxin system PemK/MazF family toxin n=1 Tax=Pusillimonas sp. ANT_WB101 TaxID=2597356 RepID=UPI0011EE9A10|nr:type II toxin-antitoxin system PemK/MazF family toxin [Pusillimonas sp. ANT_WB101]KAA0889326.1 type II toxin-antitoxin system PemK/MazF family toxin [Pusillimonas sp. ANT_WB101]
MSGRGSLVTVAFQGDLGKPRPALIIQSDLLAEMQSVIVCPITSDIRDTAFRVTIEPNPANGLQSLSQVMVDKIATLSRSKIGKTIGQLDSERMRAVERTLLWVVGIA